MGRQCGFLALLAGLIGGAEAVMLPEAEPDAEQVAAALHAAHARGKGHAIVVVAEGARYNAEALAAHLRAHQARLGFEVRVTQLGYVLRGGRADGGRPAPGHPLGGGRNGMPGCWRGGCARRPSRRRQTGHAARRYCWAHPLPGRKSEAAAAISHTHSHWPGSRAIW